MADLPAWDRLAAVALIVWSLAIPVAPAGAQTDVSAAAIVNDEVISFYDLEARVQLAAASAGVADNAEVRDRLRPQVLRQLIDEKLQRQEAKRLNLEVTDAERQQAIQNIERSNNMQPGALAAFLRSRNVSFQTLVDQINATVAWQKVVRRSVRPLVDVGEEEVTEQLNQLRARGGLTEYAVSEIFLPVNRPQDDEPVRQSAERLIEQIRQGAPFPAVARQFSQSATAAVGGDMGVILQGTLDPRLEKALDVLNPREMSTPIRTDAGYYILALREKHQVAAPRAEDNLVSLRRLLVTLPPSASAEDARTQGELAQTLSANASGCSNIDRLASDMKVPASTDLGKVRIGDLPPEVRQTIATLPIGKAAPPVRVQEGFVVLLVCGREEATTGLPSRDEIAETLLAQRVESAQRRLLRDLRRAAYLDIRT